MVRWISLSWFKELYSSESDLLTTEGHAAFLERMDQEEALEIAQKHGVTRHEFQPFLEGLRNPKSIIFHGWVEQSPNLLKTLQTQAVSGIFRDPRGTLKHTLSGDFKRFVSSYLSPVLLKNIPENDMEELVNYFSFACLLDEDTAAVIEAQLFKPIRKQLSVLKGTHVLQLEQDLIDRVKPLCSDEMADAINHLSKSSYALKMEYVDSVMEAIRTPACTVRFANWILKQMERIELNNEHQYKLMELRRELAQGKLHVKQFDTTRTGVRPRTLLLFVFIALLIGGAWFLYYFKPFSEPEVYNAHDSAGMKEFSEEELKDIDSLVGIIEQETFLEGVEIDPNIIIQNGQSISVREPFENTLMEEIFSDLNKDAALQENYANIDCLDSEGFKRYAGVKNLKDRSGLKSIKFRNETDYDLIVYVTSNIASSTVYSMFVKSGATVDFKMDVNDVLTTVAGNEFVPFKPPVGSKQEEKPSSNFRYHFCETDINYYESINTSLVLESCTRKEIKFMATGGYGDVFQLVDVHNVARPY